MTTIRPFERADIPAVGALFQSVFHRRAVGCPLALEASLEDVFLRHPWQDPDLPSLVAERGGAPVGFIGAYPLRLTVGGRSLRAAVAGSLMVDGAARDGIVGARLLRRFLDGPQDISLCETANITSTDMWRRLGARTLSAASFEWVRILQPAGSAANWIAKRIPAHRVVRGIAAVADLALARTGLAERYRAVGALPAGMAGYAATADEMVEAVIELGADRPIRPDWDAETVRWLLAQSADKDVRGPLHRRVVTTSAGRIAGAYLVHGRTGEPFHALQVLARTGAAGVVLDDLFSYVREQGAVLVRGRTDAALIDHLFARRCVFLHQGAQLVRTRDAALMDAIQASPAPLLTGLAGETWSPLIGNSFDRPVAPAVPVAAHAIARDHAMSEAR